MSSLQAEIAKAKSTEKGILNNARIAKSEGRGAILSPIKTTIRIITKHQEKTSLANSSFRNLDL